MNILDNLIFHFGVEAFFNFGTNMSVGYGNATTGMTFSRAGGFVIFGDGQATGDHYLGVQSLGMTNFNDRFDLRDAANGALFLGGVNFDLLAGDGADRVFYDGEASQTCYGGGGNDRINGALAASQVFGGLGNDIITLRGVSLDTQGIAAFGDEGNDAITMTGLDGAMTAHGGVGNDVLTATSSALSVNGDEGSDTLILHLTGTEAQGISAVAAFADGGAGNDLITLDWATAAVGIAATATLDGGAGNDTVHGYVNGAATMDELFAQDTGWGHDTITGFDMATDRLYFNSITGIDDVSDLTITGDASHTLVAFGADSIDLIGVDIASFVTSVVLIN